MDARDDDGDMRGCAGGMLERVDADGAGRGDGKSPVEGRAGSVDAPPPGGLAMGCSGLTGRPGSVPGGTVPGGGRGGGTTTTPGG
jgi:hypothetical protein